MRKQRRGRSVLRLGRFRAGPWGQAGALLGCCALLLQFLVPLVHVPRVPLLAEGLYGWAAICTVGADKPALPAPDDSAPAKPAGDKALAFCPICLGLQLAGTFLPPAPIVLPASPARERPPFVPREEFAARTAPWIAAQPRGPPRAS